MQQGEKREHRAEAQSQNVVVGPILSGHFLWGERERKLLMKS